MGKVPRVTRQPDRSGHFGAYGGRYVPETLMTPLLELEAAYHEARRDPAFRGRLSQLSHEYGGRPTPFTFSERVPAHAGSGNGKRSIDLGNRACAQPPRRRARRRDDDATRRVGNVALFFNRHIDLDDVAGAHAVGARNSMNDFVVDADQHCARKPIHQGGS